MIASIFPGPFVHLDDWGREWHVDRILSREHLDLIARAVDASGYDPSDICAIHFHSEGPPMLDLLDRSLPNGLYSIHDMEET
jgi:hypothetical protein